MEKITIEQAEALALILGVDDNLAVMRSFNASVSIFSGETDEKLSGWEQSVKNQGLVPPTNK